MFSARTHRAVLMLCATTIGCAPAKQRVYVAPSSATVLSTVEEGSGPTPSHLIYVVNRSTETVTVFSVTLRECENIRLQCEPRPMNVQLSAGERRMVLKVEPRAVNQGFSFRYSFSWRPAEEAGM